MEGTKKGEVPRGAIGVASNTEKKPSLCREEVRWVHGWAEDDGAEEEMDRTDWGTGGTGDGGFAGSRSGGEEDKGSTGMASSETSPSTRLFHTWASVSIVLLPSSGEQAPEGGSRPTSAEVAEMGSRPLPSRCPEDSPSPSSPSRLSGSFSTSPSGPSGGPSSKNVAGKRVEAGRGDIDGVGVAG